MAAESATTGVFIYFADPSTPWTWFQWVNPILLLRTAYGGAETANPPVFMYLSAKGTVGNQRIIEEGETFSIVYPKKREKTQERKRGGR